MNDSLKNLSPLDGRYQNKTKQTREIFSEHALIKERVRVEIQWLNYFLTYFKPELLSEKVKKKINSLEMKSYFSGPGTDYGWRRHLPWQRLVWPRTSLCGTQQGWRPLPYEGESTIEICECRKTWLT